jgi:energy-coupling factor transporter ATP-binding protein EcfA2
MLQMESNIETHTILTGPSGSGKSTFLRRVVRPALGDDLIFNSSYLDFIKTFIDIIPAPDHLVPRKMELEEAITAFLKQPIQLSINKVLQDNTLFETPKVLVEIGDRAEAFIRDALRDRPTTYFVFDQIERFLSDLKHLQYQPNEAARTLSVYIVIRVFKTLRQLRNTRTIFAIRADFLFASIDFLTYSLDKLEDADGIFRYFYFNGINASTSPEAIKQIRLQYNTINSPADWDDFVKFTALKSKSVSNTFLTQLAGYMLENFGRTDPRVAEIMSSEEKTPDDFLEVFFEHLIAGFHQTQKERSVTTSSRPWCSPSPSRTGRRVTRSLRNGFPGFRTFPSTSSGRS